MKLPYPLLPIVIFTLSACAAPVPTVIPATSAPSVDVAAVQTKAALAVLSTLTANAPTATNTPSRTNTFTRTNTPTLTRTPTSTHTTTLTPNPTSTPLPTTMPTRAFTSVPTRRPINPTPIAEFLFNWRAPNYECQKHLTYRGGFGFDGVRWFQITFDVKNISNDKTLNAPWQPTRWVITNGTNTRTDDKMWQYGARGGDATNPQFFQQPDLSPNVATEWTFGAYPLQEGEWVDHLEWELFGQSYVSKSFSPGDFNNAYNYKPCP